MHVYQNIWNYKYCFMFLCIKPIMLHVIHMKPNTVSCKYTWNQIMIHVMYMKPNTVSCNVHIFILQTWNQILFHVMDMKTNTVSCHVHKTKLLTTWNQIMFHVMYKKPDKCFMSCTWNLTPVLYSCMLYSWKGAPVSCIKIQNHVQ